MNWYVLFVKSRQELKIKKFIDKSSLEVETFCPTRTEIKQWTDRKKKLQVPILTGIVFIKTIEQNRDSVFLIPGVKRYLFEFGKPAIVKEHELNKLKSISENKNIIDHKLDKLLPGENIDLTPYGFKDIFGVVKKSNNKICWITLETFACTLKITLK